MKTGSDTSRIISIGTAVPDYSSRQDTILSFMQEAYQDADASRKLRVLFHQSGINTRHSTIPDFSGTDERKLFPITHKQPDVAERMEVFRQNALPLALKSVKKAFENIETSVRDFGITHLITVSCTGLYAPGLDADLILALDLPPDTFRTSLNFLGCNAAFPAMKMADSFVKSHADARVLVVCVELCTLHFQPKSNSDNLLSNTIFGDGAAAVIMVSDEMANKEKRKGFSLTGFCPLLLNSGKNLMGWNITPLNFEMVLDAGIPEFLGGELDNLLELVAKKLGLTPDAIQHWAVHPGGKKILSTVEREMQMKNNELRHSYDVLRDYGNMSSPTILFVLNEIFNSNPKSGETILALGFGPGISIETASLVCHGFV